MGLQLSLSISFLQLLRLPRGLTGKEPTCQCRRYGFNPWVRKIPWRRKWQPTPVFLPGESHGQRSLAGYSREESDTTVCVHTGSPSFTLCSRSCSPGATAVWRPQCLTGGPDPDHLQREGAPGHHALLRLGLLYLSTSCHHWAKENSQRPKWPHSSTRASSGLCCLTAALLLTESITPAVSLSFLLACWTLDTRALKGLGSSCRLELNRILGNSLVVRWLGHGALTARALVQSLVRELRSHKLHSATKRKGKETNSMGF